MRTASHIVRSIGARLDALQGFPVDLYQIHLANGSLSSHRRQLEISLLHRDIETNGVLDAARRLGVTLIAYSPLRSGLLTGAFHAAPERLESIPLMRRTLMGVTRRNVARSAPLIDELNAVARAHGATAAQVALSWLTTFYGDTVVAIPGASKPRHAQEAAAAMDLALTPGEADRINRASRMVTAPAHVKSA